MSKQNWKKSIREAAGSLKKKEKDLEKELSTIREKRKRLEEMLLSSTPKTGQGRKLSPKGRAAISRAAKKRWAKYRREKKRGK